MVQFYVNLYIDRNRQKISGGRAEGGIALADYRELADKKVKNGSYFDFRRFFSMFTVWLLCLIFSFFPLALRPMFTKAATAVDAGYWVMVFSDNDVLYITAAASIIAVGMSVLMGRRSTMFVYLLAFFEVIAIFLAIMGYLMLEGDPMLFGVTVYKINIGFLIVSVILALVMFITVNFKNGEGVGR